MSEKTTGDKVIEGIFGTAIVFAIIVGGFKWIYSNDLEANIRKGKVYLDGGYAYYCNMGATSQKRKALIEEAKKLRE